MTQAMITPVLMCGGSGTRLWPVSRKQSPKQFARILNDRTLFQDAVLRFNGTGWKSPFIVTSENYVATVRAQLCSLGSSALEILVEPSARNTGPAVLAAAIRLADRSPDALMLIAPSDHAIPDSAAFRNSIEAGVDAAQSGKIVTFGIQPTRPETGYGWLKLAERPVDELQQPIALENFEEKPDADKARAMLEAGSYLWNAGIFLAKPATLVEAFCRHAPELVSPVAQALQRGRCDDGIQHMSNLHWNQVADISIDYAVMERADNLVVVPFTGNWSDLGDWDAVWRESEVDADGITAAGAVLALDCKDSLLRNDVEGLQLVTIGMSDIIAVVMDDTVMIAPRSRVQDVKKAVDELKKRGLRQAEHLTRRHREGHSLKDVA